MTLVKKYTSFKYGKFQKQLDEWIGTERYIDDKHEYITNYEDERICKYSLCGCCPYNLLESTRLTKGPCKSYLCPCPSDLKEKYENTNFGLVTTYDKQLFEFLNSLITDCDMRVNIYKNKKNNKETVEDDDIKSMNNRIDSLRANARRDALQGRVLKAYSDMVQADTLIEQKKKREKDVIKKQDERVYVCEECSAIVRNYDAGSSIQLHKNGRQHQAFLIMRETLQKLKAKGCLSSNKGAGKFSNPQVKKPCRKFVSII